VYVPPIVINKEDREMFLKENLINASVEKFSTMDFSAARHSTLRCTYSLRLLNTCAALRKYRSKNACSLFEST
jgi:hypothetical protein